MTVEHTKTPWEVREHNKVSYIYAENGDYALAQMQFTSKYEDEANAAFIVTACNNFKDMKAALTAIVQRYEDGNKLTGKYDSALLAAKAILQRIEGGE